MSKRKQAMDPARGGDAGQPRAGERVFEVALRLFRNEGIRAVGVETIVKQAGVAKISLYRNFASKDELIVAYLNKMNATYWANVDEHLARRVKDPRRQLRAYLAYIAASAMTPGYRGCPFINYAAEFPDASHPGHRVAEANRIEMRRRLVEWTKRINPSRAAKLAEGLLLLISGAYAGSQTMGGKGPASALVWAGECLIDGAS